MKMREKTIQTIVGTKVGRLLIKMIRMMRKMRRRKYLDDANLLEELSHFVSRDIFAQSFHEDGVVVRVVLIP